MKGTAKHEWCFLLPYGEDWKEGRKPLLLTAETGRRAGALGPGTRGVRGRRRNDVCSTMEMLGGRHSPCEVEPALLCSWFVGLWTLSSYLRPSSHFDP